MEIQIQSFSKDVFAQRLSECITTTKNLAFQNISKTNNKLKLVVSTQLLGAHHWFKGTKHTETVIGKGKGLRLTRAVLGLTEPVKKIYERSYKKGTGRKEEMIDIRNQSHITDAFCGAKRAHIVITKDEILITPLFDASNFVNKAGNIFIPDISIVKDAIISVLDTIEANKLTHISFKAAPEFWESDHATILITQLRRLGYTIDKTNDDVKAVQNNNADLHYMNIELTKCKPIQAPPVSSNPLECFVGFSGGFDAHLLEREGFDVTSALEWAPPEKRDTTDKSEHYALSLMMNTNVKHLFNEDIYFANIPFIAELNKNIGHAHFSLSCTDFSSLKTKKARAKAIDELTTSRDMFVPTLKLISKMAPLTLSVENVPNFANSAEYQIFISRLERLGYKVCTHTLNAPHFGGLTSRKRMYIFATRLNLSLEHFGEVQTKSATISAWDAVKSDFNNMRDVSHTKSVQKGIDTGRIRPLKEGDKVGPAIFRSQNRQLKDTCYLLHNNKYYLPTVNQLRALSGMPESFKMNFLSIEQQTAIIGQGIDAELHTAWIERIKIYLLAATH
ncbi:DNA cytosine methyltransferase [Marinomonas sp. TI.3.20]|uniref:DNA cytosine methyltransferase n=1 Tax=Marinomonas sp. TI.3.20 TaxID=3121296 RepID=UPI00311FD818